MKNNINNIIANVSFNSYYFIKARYAGRFGIP